MPASGAVPYGQQRELLVISRALGINLLEFFVVDHETVEQ
jgi:hypothetical protein